MAAPKKNTTDRAGAMRSRTLVLVTVLLLLAIVVSGSWLYYGRTRTEPAPSLSDSPQPQNNAEVALGPMVDAGEFIVNIISDDNSHYLRTSLTIELSNQQAHDEITMRMPQIRDAILMLANSKTFEELYDVHGKKQLKAELLVELNEMLTRGEAVAIYFTDFVVQ